MKYYVNDSCIGCGLCEGTCPEVFRITDENVAVAIEDDVELESAAEAKENCPVGAIEEKDTFREAAKDVAVKAVKLARSLKKSAVESADIAAEKTKKAIDDAKPYVEKKLKGIKTFIDEVKEEANKSE